MAKRLEVRITRLQTSIIEVADDFVLGFYEAPDPEWPTLTYDQMLALAQRATHDDTTIAIRARVLDDEGSPDGTGQ